VAHFRERRNTYRVLVIKLGMPKGKQNNITTNLNYIGYENVGRIEYSR